MSSVPIDIRFASTDDDVINIHRFLCAIAGPTLPGPIDQKKSIEEIWRVVNEEAAIMAMQGDDLIGTIGLAKFNHWWGDTKFIGNRFAFAVPGSKAWRPMLQQCRTIAVAAGLECIIASEERGKLTIINKSKARSRQ